MIKINKLTNDSTYKEVLDVCIQISNNKTIGGYGGAGVFDVYKTHTDGSDVLNWVIRHETSYNFFQRKVTDERIAANTAFIEQLNTLLKHSSEVEFIETVDSLGTDWNRRKIDFVNGELKSWSKDPSTKVSAALFNGKYNICSSYNGFPPGVEDTPDRLNNRELKYKIVQHAEANLISTCARLGIKTEGMSIAVSAFPCTTCAGQIISAGITEVITVEPSDDLKLRWSDDFKLSRELFEEAGVTLTIVK